MAIKILLILSVIFHASLCGAWEIVYDGRTVSAGGGETCSGDISDGDNESFESSEGTFCTTDWTDATTNTVLSTFDSAYSHCGSTSMSIEMDGDIADNEDVVYVNFGDDGDHYLRFYFWTDGNLPSGAYGRIMSYNNLVGGAKLSTINPGIQLYNMSGTLKLSLRDGNENPSDRFTISAATKYRIEIHYDDSASTCMKVFDSGGTAVETDDGGGDYECCVTDTNTPRYFVFSSDSSSTTASAYYIDDFVIDLDAVDYIGAQTCN